MKLGILSNNIIKKEIELSNKESELLSVKSELVSLKNEYKDNRIKIGTARSYES